MATWNSRGLRGSTLEDMINNTNEYYRQKNLALVQKIPTPITPIKIDKDSSQITLAYFEKNTGISPWHILTRSARWIISGRSRGFRSVSMQRNVPLIHLQCVTFMSIR